MLEEEEEVLEVEVVVYHICIIKAGMLVPGVKRLPHWELVNKAPQNVNRHKP